MIFYLFEGSCKKIISITSIVSEKSFNYNGIVLKVRFKPFVTISEEFYLYDELTLVANVGGFLGLALGISISNIKDVIEKILVFLNYHIFEKAYKAYH